MREKETRVCEQNAQLYTLEGLAAAIVILFAITYAFNAVVVTPDSSLNPGAETNEKVAEDLLAVADEKEDGSQLAELLLNWDEDGMGFENSTEGVYYYEGEDPDPDHLGFGSDARSLLTEEGLSYNIDASFRKPDGEVGSLTVVDNGEPGSSAVSASRTVILLEEDGNVTDVSGEYRADAGSYPIPDDPERGSIYNQVTVRMTVW